MSKRDWRTEMERCYGDTFTLELEARLRALPLGLRRVIVAAGLVVAVPMSFFDRLAREWWFGLRMAVLDVKGDIEEARRVWRR